MITLKYTVLLASVPFFGACVAPSTTPAPTTPTVTNHGCPEPNPGIRPININYTNSPIVVAPSTQTADAGDVLQFNIIGANNIQVSTSGKTPVDGWLNGNGKKKAGKPASQKFYICVPTDLFPPDAPSGEELDFGYNVNAVGKPPLDPIVRVRNP